MKVIILITVFVMVKTASSIHFHLDADDLQEHYFRFRGDKGQKKLKRLTELRKTENSKYLDEVFQKAKSKYEKMVSKQTPKKDVIQPFEGGAEADAIDIMFKISSFEQQLLENSRKVSPYRYLRKGRSKDKKSGSDPVISYILDRKKPGSLQ